MLFIWQKPVIMSYTLHVGYVKSIQQSASAVAEYPHAFDSTLQSERLHSQSTHTTVLIKTEPVLSYYFRSNPSTLVGCCLWLKSLNSLLLYNPGPSLILKLLLLFFSHNNIMKYHIGSISGRSNNVSGTTSSSQWQLLCFSVEMCASLSIEKMTLLPPGRYIKVK